jgi:hypothetical protein
MAGMFALMFIAIAFGTSYLGGEITGDQIARIFGIE